MLYPLIGSFLYTIYLPLMVINFHLAYAVKYLLVRVAIRKNVYNLDLFYRSEYAFLKAYRWKYGSVRKRKIKNTSFEGIKVGIVGPVSNHMAIMRETLAYHPEKVQLYSYDFLEKNVTFPAEMIEKKSRYRSYFFERFRGSTRKRIFSDSFEYGKLAGDINADELDMLIIIMIEPMKFTISKMIEMIDTPVIVSLSNSNTFLVNDKCNIKGQLQIPNGYRIIDKRLFSSRSQSAVKAFYFFDDFYSYDHKNITLNPSTQRENAMLYLGRIMKINHPDFLAVIVDLIKECNVAFYFMGITHRQELQEVMRFFEDHEVIGNVRYLGQYSTKKDTDGKIKDPQWQKALEKMSQCKLFLDPFPIGGGTANIEAYCAGIPVVSLHDPEGNRSFHNLNAIYTKSGTVKTTEEYLSLCKKILDDNAVVKKIQNEQIQIAKKFTTPEMFWKKVEEVYDFSVMLDKGQC